MKNWWKKIIGVCLLATVAWGNVKSGDAIVHAENLEETATYSEKVDYVLVDQPCLTTPGEQNIVIGIGDGDVSIENAYLTYYDLEKRQQYSVAASAIADNSVRFQIRHNQSEEETATMVLRKIQYIVNGHQISVTFAEMGMDVRYGLNQEADTTPDDIFFDEDDIADLDLEANIVSFDEEGNVVSENSIEEALSDSAEDVVSGQIRGYSFGRKNGNLVVVLDPGHDSGGHGGTQAGGLQEEKLNLKIAQYCREELLNYAGVTVYLTRDDSGKCPYPGTSVKECNEKRVAFAQSVGADVYIALHNNYSPSSSVKGVYVYYPNKNYNPEISREGKELADVINKQLSALGLQSRENQYRTCVDHDPEYLYPDGSQADYYAVIRNAKRAGIPAIIVEHAFQSNASDVKNFLGNEEGLKKLGVADATAIATYYNLTKYGIFVCEQNRMGVTAGMTHPAELSDDLEYRWTGYNIAEDRWFVIQEWKQKDEWLHWNPGRSGDYLLRCEVRKISDPDCYSEVSIGVNHQGQIKGKCQMPYSGEGGGYLIGVESYDNPDQSYQYEMLILDCTLLAEGKPAWIYSTGKCRVESGNANWTIWQPQYGYYWTLFRVFDGDGNMLDEACYPFVNAY